MLLTAYNEDQSTGSWVLLMLPLHSDLVVSSKGGDGLLSFSRRRARTLKLKAMTPKEDLGTFIRCEHSGIREISFFSFTSAANCNSSMKSKRNHHPVKEDALLAKI